MPEADLVERPAEEPVHFVTPPAAPPRDELVEDRGRIAADLALELHIEILVRNVLDVTAMQTLERVRIGPRAPLELDAVEIGLKLHRAFI